MYFRKDETEDSPTWICTNSSGAFVAAAIQDEDDSWRVQLPSQKTEDDGVEEVAASKLTSLEEALDFILELP